MVSEQRHAPADLLWRKRVGTNLKKKSCVGLGAGLEVSGKSHPQPSFKLRNFQSPYRLRCFRYPVTQIKVLLKRLL